MRTPDRPSSGGSRLDYGQFGRKLCGEKHAWVDRSRRFNKGIFPCNQWRRVWSVPSGFNELRDVAEMRRKQSSPCIVAHVDFLGQFSALSHL